MSDADYLSPDQLVDARTERHSNPPPQGTEGTEKHPTLLHGAAQRAWPADGAAPGLNCRSIPPYRSIPTYWYDSLIYRLHVSTYYGCAGGAGDGGMFSPE